MLRALRVIPGGAAGHTIDDVVVLDHTDRHRRRITLNGVRGISFLLDLESATALRNGDALVLDDGRLVEIVAAPEELSEIRCGNALQVARMAWHLGNRHLPAEIYETRIRIRRDPIIEDMARGLGGKIVLIEAPFEPEGGAYAAPHTPAPRAPAPHAHEHKHTDACTHDHHAGHKHG